jgi:hypothetical protein
MMTEFSGNQLITGALIQGWFSRVIYRTRSAYWRINTGMVLKSDIAHALLPQAADRSMLERLAQVGLLPLFFKKK